MKPAAPGREPRPPLPWGQALGAGAIALFAVTHLASVVSDFRATAGLHRWLMTYSEGFHRRGLVGTLFQAVVGHEPREAQIALASRISDAGNYLWLAAAFGLILFAAARTRDRPVAWVTLAFAAFAFINPMWTTRAYDNGFLDWLVGLVLVGALAAFVLGRPLLSGTVVAFGIIAYWGTIFVWLPLGFLIACLLVRDVFGHDATEAPLLHRTLAACRTREFLSVLLPLAAAALAALFHDNDVAVAELTRIGGQQHIIEQTFTDVGGAVMRQVEALLRYWREYLGVGAVYVLPPAVCAALWTCVMRRAGRSVFQPPWLDTATAVLATLTPLLFLLVAFDLSRLMAWTYFAFFVVAVFWLTRARPGPDVRPAAISPLAAVPLILAAFFWTSPTIYAWADLSQLIRCERFCFKERTPQGRALDLFRRRFIASPIWEVSAPGGALWGATGRRERVDGSDDVRRVARAGRDKPGNLLDINNRLAEPAGGLTIRAPVQTQNAIVGSGPHRVAISYRAEGTETANAETRLWVYNGTFTGAIEILRAPLPPHETEFLATITIPPAWSGNSIRWMIHYNGTGVFELHRISLVKAASEKQIGKELRGTDH